VLVISMYDDRFTPSACSAPVAGAHHEQEGPDAILRAIRQVVSGQIFLSGKNVPCSWTPFDTALRRRSPVSLLTDRELEVLQLLGQAKDSHAIAKHLHVSTKTVDAHRGKIKEKLNLSNATELICYAAAGSV